MELSQLQTLEPSLEVLSPKGFSGTVGFPCDLSIARDDSFYFAKDEKFYRILKELLSASKTSGTSGVGVVLQRSLVEKLSSNKGEWDFLCDRADYILQVDSVPLAISRISRPYYLQVMEKNNDEVDGRQMGSAQIDSSAYIAQGVFVGADVVLGANVKIHSGVVLMSGVEVGEDSEIYPNATVYHNVKIGERVRIHGGAVIGADGFGYNYDKGVHHKVWHFGSVVIEDDVEIGANSCIDGGTFSPTRIGRGSKIDNHVQVGHNCVLEEGVILCGQVGLGGSSKIGKYSIFGGRSGTVDNITVGPSCKAAGGAVLTSDCSEGLELGGHPARPIREWLKGVAHLRRISLNGRGNGKGAE